MGPDGKMTFANQEEPEPPVWHHVISKTSVDNTVNKTINAFFVVQPKVTQQDYVSQ
jgi:hypothetical protein